MRLRFAILLFAVVYLLLFFVNWPSLSFYIPTFDVDINTIQDAQKALLEQNGALKKLADDTRNYNFYTFLLFTVLAADLIPAFHSFSSALVPGESVDEDIDNDKLISIFEEDKNNGK